MGTKINYEVEYKSLKKDYNEAMENIKTKLCKISELIEEIEDLKEEIEDLKEEKNKFYDKYNENNVDVMRLVIENQLLKDTIINLAKKL